MLFRSVYYFSVRSQMLIVDSDGPPSWSLDASKTGESTKCSWLGVVAFCTLPSFARIKRPRWRPVELNDRHLRSHGKIGDCEQSTYVTTICIQKPKILSLITSRHSKQLGGCILPESPRSYNVAEHLRCFFIISCMAGKDGDANPAGS